LFTSCKEEKVWADLVIPTRVSFEASSLIVPKGAKSFPIALTLARPLEKSGKITIQILEEGTTALPTEYSIDPKPLVDRFTVELPKGTTTAVFTITSAKNFDEDKTLVLKIVSGGGGAVLNEKDLSTTLTLRGNNWIEPIMT